ncbi:MAG TPA: hypothetical protein DCG75_11710 [Bacteroidales bacterium]|nr:hypothetical protein [Bacteroidales bacterium]
MEKINKTDVKALSAKDVNSDSLGDFYNKAYPKRANYTEDMWKWIYRSYLCNNEIPHVLVYKDQVIAHAGTIPVNVTFDDKKLTFSWFTDFKVLPEFQGQGLGPILSKERMKDSEIHVGLTNTPNSLKALLKLGWKESTDTYFHRNFIKPFSHPRFARKMPLVLQIVLNFLSNPFLYFIYKKHFKKSSESDISKLDENSLKRFYDLYLQAEMKKKSKNMVLPIRDEDFLTWRIKNSPNREKYYIYSVENFSAILLLNNNHGEYIDILWVSDNTQFLQIRNMISTLFFWGRNKGDSYIRFYTTNKELSYYLKKHTKSVVTNPTFSFFSENKSLLNKLENAKWDVELIDNDFEKFI